MDSRIGLAILLAVASVSASDSLSAGMKIVGRMYGNCEKSTEMIKCFKIQAAKLADRAARMETLPLIDGVTLVKRADVGRSFSSAIPDVDLDSLTSDQIDKILADAAAHVLGSHRLNISPLSLGTDISRSFEEARGRMKRYIGPLLTALAIKAGFVIMAFQTIAVIAGKALLIGKIALVLSAIIGLKKLVTSGEAHEKTTYEIVKHPQVSQSHTYSSSHYGGDFDTSGPGGPYRRSVEDEALAAAQDRAYRAYRRH